MIESEATGVTLGAEVVGPAGSALLPALSNLKTNVASASTHDSVEHAGNGVMGTGNE